MSTKPVPPTKPILFACEAEGCKNQSAHRFARDGKKVCASCNDKAHDIEGERIRAAARAEAAAEAPPVTPA